jgi:uncharacterized delta-60 repeat protein
MRTAVHRTLVALLLTGTVLAAPGRAGAATGAYDPTFGTGGTASIASTLLGPNNNASHVVQQPDGRLVATGKLGSALAIVRFELDGSLDPGFADAGRLFVTAFGEEGSGSAAALQADGSIVAVGATDAPAPVLVRCDAAGVLDPGFGTGGLVELPFGGSLFGVAVQPGDGKIVAVGERRTGVGLATDLLVVRFGPDGVLDAGFAAGGVFTFDRLAFDALFSVALQPDGKIVAIGSSGATFFPREPLLLRLDPSGAPDGSFGAGGISVTVVPGTFFGGSLVIQPDGKLLGGGLGGVLGTGSRVIRWDASGALDPGFGTGGAAELPHAAFIPNVALQADGKIVAVATLGVPPNLVVARLDPDGVLDPTFGTGGVTLNPYDSGGGSRNAILQSDGRIVTSAQVGAGFALVRFDNGFCPATPLAGCDAATASRLTIAAKSIGHRIAWRWRGPETDVADFGDPVSVTTHAVCVYDAAGVVLEAIAPAGAAWQPTLPGFRYRDRSAVGRLRTVKLALRGRLRAAGRGLAVDDPLPVVLPLTVQLVRSDGGRCWEAVYGTASVNVPARVHARLP